MRSLRWMALVVALLAFFHACMVVGLVFKTPGAGSIYRAYLDQQAPLWLAVPAKVYGAVGRLVWESPWIGDILDHVYSPVYRRLGEHAVGLKGQKATPAPLVDSLNIGLINAVVLVSLALFILLSLLPKKDKIRDRRK